MMADDKLLQLYFEGDRIGAPAEGMPGAKTSYEELMKRQWEYPNGTDESDSVRKFILYADNYDWQGDYADFATGWARYITYNHAVTNYGKTWRHLFSLVRSVEKSTKQPITHGTLIEIARDVNSCGNGCLALVYPATIYAQEVGADPLQLSQAVTEISHAHPQAQLCVSALVEYYHDREGSLRISAVFSLPDQSRDLTPLAQGCLWAALESARESTKEDVISRAAEIGGDLDSHLALGMLLWGHRGQSSHFS